jgi:hypothetical protein
MKPNRSGVIVAGANYSVLLGRVVLCLGALVLAFGSGEAEAQELRYSWLDMSFMGQDVSRAGSLPSPGVPDQIVDIAVSDGTGVRFRGSVGTWNNFYLMLDYGSTDIDLVGSVSNPGVPEPEVFADEFDYTAIRGGIGLRFSIFDATDIYGEITYDSLDFDFGSFAGEDFDMGREEVGGTLGVRTMFGDHFQVGVHGRFTNVGDADLTTGIFDTDTLIGVGFAWELIRGLSLVGDFESGEFSSWSVGFRLDLDED